MNETRNTLNVHLLNTAELKNLKFELVNLEYSAALIDSTGYEIVKGYGESIEDAMNDLHHNLL
ncbi:hypothetical protein GCM10022393_33750 [Aquimarina addita]|uniref:Uncharacterized protein n=1 Tax=Aquimarina addita TaxID=870485 RepID=A0ABP6UQ67_9FLAO